MELQLWRKTLEPYSLAVDELIVKFNHIKNEFDYDGEYSPIESVNGRVKRISSILEKAQRKHIELEDVESKLDDIAGVRIICRFVEDIDKVVEILRKRSDMKIVEEKDYITKSKKSGYRSYHLIIEYAVPIIVITLAVILGQAFFGTMGVMLAGQPLKTAMQCGFSLTQIGEFAFIIASLGLSLHVTSDFLYPIVVAVSVITTFLTPYMIRVAEPASNFVDRKLPESWRRFLMRYTTGTRTVNHESLWRKLLFALARILVVYSIVSISVITLSFRFVVPLLREHLPGIWGPLAGAVFTILCISPFLRAIMVKKNHSVEFITLWNDNRVNRGPLVSTVVFRVAVSVLFVMFVITRLFKASVGLMFGVALLLVILMILSRQLKKQSILIERKFFQNLRSRDMRAEYLGEKKPAYAGRLLSRDLHLTDFEIPGESAWAGKTLLELNLGKKYGVHVVSILRGKRRINIPGGSIRLFPMDKIQVIGTDDQLNTFAEEMSHVAVIDSGVFEKSEMTLKQLLIDTDSAFLGKTLRESGIRDKYHCLIAGVERGGEALMTPDVNVPFEEGDVVWVVGENEDVYRLIGQNCDRKR